MADVQLWGPGCLNSEYQWLGTAGCQCSTLAATSDQQITAWNVGSFGKMGMPYDKRTMDVVNESPMHRHKNISVLELHNGCQVAWVGWAVWVTSNFVISCVLQNATKNAYNSFNHLCCHMQPILINGLPYINTCSCKCVSALKHGFSNQVRLSVSFKKTW